MGFDLGSLLSQFTGGGNAASASDQFQQVSQSASPDLLSQGLSAMFHSDQTPPFGQMAGQLFGQANPNQQAGMLNQLLSLFSIRASLHHFHRLAHCRIEIARACTARTGRCPRRDDIPHNFLELLA